MKTTVSARSSVARRIEVEEDYDRDANLTEEQKTWQELNRLFYQQLRKQHSVEHMVIGFKAAKIPRKKYEPLTLEKPIVHKDQVLAVMLSSIDARYWSRAKEKRRYRLNYLETRLRRQSAGTGDVELWATGENEEGEFVRKLAQKDLLLRPLKDHPRFNVHEYDPAGLLAGTKIGDQLIGDPVLKSPIPGMFNITRDELHCDIKVGDASVFRFMLKDMDSVVTHSNDTDGSQLAKPGEMVDRGAPLVKLQEKVHYGALKFTRDGRPDIDRIYGDLFGASYRIHSGNILSLRLALSMWRRLIWAMAGDDQLSSPVPFANWAPRHLLEFTADTIWTFPVRETWRATPALRTDLLEAVSPKGHFYIRADIDHADTVAEIGDNGRNICYVSGKVQQLPCQARLLESVKKGASFVPEAPVADWVPREFCDWKVLEDLPYLGLMVQHFLQEKAVRPGVDGYSGNEMLLPADYVPDELRSTIPAEDYLDFRAAKDYFDDEGGVYIGPPLKQTDWTDLVREANGILYSGYPRGGHLSANPIVR